MNKFDLYYPIFDLIGIPPITLDMVFNPIYPDHIKWHCKCSRKKFKKGGTSHAK